MMPLPHYRGTTVGVLGLGPEGRACAMALIDSGATVVAWDADETRHLASPIRIAAPEDWPVERMAAIVLADGGRGGVSMGLTERASAADVPVMSELDIFGASLRRLPSNARPTVVAVTGAAGKSVTCSLIAHVLASVGRDVHIGGPLGEPLMAMPAPRQGQVYVLELPVRRLATARHMKADVSVVLNVASGDDPDQVELALRSILRVFKGQGPDDTAIIGVDDPLGQKIGTMLRAGQLTAGAMGTIVPFSGESALGHGVFTLNDAAYSAKLGKTTQLGDFSGADAAVAPFFGRDAAAAIAACQSLGVPATAVIKALHSYQGLRGRYEYLGSDDRIAFVDDTFARSPLAAKLSTRTTLDVFWIGADGVAKSDLTAMAKGAVRCAHLVGNGRAPTETVRAGNNSIQVTRHGKIEQAFAAAYSDAVAYAAKDADASPLVLCAPGVAVKDGRFEQGAFRALASEVIDTEVRHVG